jgi:hypothetical protein
MNLAPGAGASEAIQNHTEELDGFVAMRLAMTLQSFVGDEPGTSKRPREWRGLELRDD